MMDLIDPSQKKLVEPLHVSATPTLILFNQEGQEILRSEDILEAEKFIQHLQTSYPEAAFVTETGKGVINE